MSSPTADRSAEESAGGQGSRAKAARIVFTIMAGVAGLYYAALMGGASLIAPWFDDSTKGHQIHDVGWGILVAILTGVPLLLQLRRPESKPAAMQQVLLVALSMVLVPAAAGTFAPFVLIFFVVPAALLTLLHPARHEMFRLGRFSPTLAVMAAVGGLGWTAFALNQISKQRTVPSTNEHTEDLHWVFMGVLGVAIILVALLGALKTRGSRIPAWTAGIASIFFGIASLVMNQRPSSIKGFGVLAILGGVAFIAEAEWEHRQDEPSAEVAVTPSMSFEQRAGASSS
ncbi:MAG: hypothetical protein M3345_01480 [Actinomycetota bacterium]|nr:hypothetical protein [Actinomycetota bacterium]